MLLALAYPVFPMPSPPPARSMTIPATRIILPRVAPSPTHTSTPPLSHSSTPNGAAVAGGIAAAIVIVIIAAFRYFRRRWRRTKAPSAEFIVDPEPKEAGGLKAINAQPEPSNDCRKESSDEEALGLSTMPDLPATPMGIYNSNGAATLPEPQDDLYTRNISSRTIFGQYQGTETTPVLANTQAPWLQGHSVLPTIPEPRYDLYARGVSQANFGQYQGTRNAPRQVNTQVPRPQGHGGPSTSPEPQDESYSPKVSPKVIFGQNQGTESILPNIRASRPLGYHGLPTF